MSSELQMIVDVTSRIFEDHQTEERHVDAWDAELWNLLETTGLSGVASLDTHDDGAGRLRECAAILRVAGRFAVSVPLAEHYLSTWLLSKFGLPVPSGPLTFAVSSGLDVRRSGEVWRVSGTISRVPWAGIARCIVVIGRSEEDEVLMTIFPPDRGVVVGHNVAGEPRDDVVIDIKLGANRVAKLKPGTTRAIQLRSALYKVALIAGATERAFELSLNYVGERIQFGRAIGSFQVVQHQIAEMAGEVLALRTACDAAVECCITESPLRWPMLLAVASAKSQAGRSATVIARTSHQLHGAIGFTYEHSLRMSTTRLWAWRDECGSETYWANEVGSHLLGTEDELWAALVGADSGDLRVREDICENVEAGVQHGN